MKPTRVLFINSVDDSREVESRFPSLAFGYLIAYLKQSFPPETFEFKIADRDISAELSKRFRPDVVCISSVTQNFNRAKTYARMAKHLCGVPVIVGGIHITVLPETLTEDMDVGVMGEGELKLVALLKILMEKDSFSPDVLEQVPGIIYWKNGERIETERENVLPDVSTLPFPAREYLTIDKHTYMFTSRGCPYRCAFCASTRLYKTVRWHTPEQVVGEIEVLKERYGVNLITFYDDLFAGNRKRLREIGRLLKERGLAGKVRFTGNARANIVDQELCDLFNDMGLVSVNMGLESGCQKTLDYLKEGVTVEQNWNAVQLLKKNGIFTSGSFIIGSPDETLEDIMETYRCVKKMPLSITDIYILMPLPGTPVWDEALERGLVSNDMDWDKISFCFDEHAILMSRQLSYPQLAKVYRMFRQARFLKLLRGIPGHPYLSDLPRIVFRQMLADIKSLVDRMLCRGPRKKDSVPDLSSKNHGVIAENSVQLEEVPPHL